ncbi:hypothetical protein BGX26_002439 [Mortierella sp. AD094]|nr:hypothetical protein BGX26_002439 [Mortierella sp. AD094]
MASTASDFEIDKSLKVSRLKEAIRIRKFPELKDADEIKLWRVAIPVTVDEEDKESTATSISSKQLMKGGPDLSQYFPDAPPPNTIHIFVERPQGITTASSHTSLSHVTLYDSEEHEDSSSDIISGNECCFIKDGVPYIQDDSSVDMALPLHIFAYGDYFNIHKCKRHAPDDDDDGNSCKRAITLETQLSGRQLDIPSQQKQYSHTFYDRESYFRKIIPHIAGNYNSRGLLDHKSHTTFLVPGGSGIGKSRAGYELQHLITHADQLGIDFNIRPAELDAFREALQNPCYLYVNLNNGCAYDHDIDERHKDGDVRMGVRLAVAAGLSGKTLAKMTTYRLELFTVADVIQEILKRRFSTSGRTLEDLIIHIDEYQQYVWKAQEEGQ